MVEVGRSPTSSNLQVLIVRVWFSLVVNHLTRLDKFLLQATMAIFELLFVKPLFALYSFAGCWLVTCDLPIYSIVAGTDFEFAISLDQIRNML